MLFADLARIRLKKKRLSLTMAAPDQPDQPDQDLFAGSKEFPEGRTSLRENQLSSIRSTRAPLATDWETALHLQAFERRLATAKIS